MMANVTAFDSISTLPLRKEPVQFPRSSRTSTKAIFHLQELYIYIFHSSTRRGVGLFKVIGSDKLRKLPAQKESKEYPKSSKTSMKAIFCPQESHMMTIWFIAPYDVEQGLCKFH